MSVAEVWGRIQGHDASLISQAGDVWSFIVPAWVTGPVIVEFWARDDAGNTTYRSAIFSIEDGTKKCILKWLDDHGICTMLGIKRYAEMMDTRPRIAMAGIRRDAEMMDVRPTVTMERHICTKMEA